ncbi:antibiotic biosynthesis monooxygenase [Nocardioides limicola]|uniref:antibiotic biosynthesis monooxygenase n=1 Tax=Nocardioides limicola TaxID=2803368 RepID=UPI00193B8E9F|nr:antibiotic biosynthesis monooxygenase family protein [Nocardioides sp. DJM-14]
MLVVNRFRVPGDEAAGFRTAAEEFRALMLGCPGSLDATLGRNVDDPELWVLATSWENVGSYRRALSAHRGAAMALMRWAIDEPGGFERVEPGAVLNDPSARGECAEPPTTGH